MGEWVADHEGEVASIDVDGVTFRVERPVQAVPGRIYLVKPGSEAGSVVLKRPWSTPTLTEHDDRAIRSGIQGGHEGSPTTPAGVATQHS